MKKSQKGSTTSKEMEEEGYREKRTPLGRKGPQGGGEVPAPRCTLKERSRGIRGRKGNRAASYRGEKEIYNNKE